MSEESIEHIDFEAINEKAISQPLVSHIYTADPSAHVFEGKIYIYPSHDIDAEFLSTTTATILEWKIITSYLWTISDAPTVDSGVVLHVNDVAWAERQMWAPDAATKNGKYYLYFPAKRANGIFQIGVAISDSPTGPFLQNHKPSKAVTALIQPFSKMKTGNTTFILAEFGAANFKNIATTNMPKKTKTQCTMNLLQAPLLLDFRTI